MGSVRLKAKDIHNYRKAGIINRNCGRSCEDCRYFVYMSIIGMDESDLYRCSVMGIKSSRKYRIRKDHICNMFKSMGFKGKLDKPIRYRSCFECKPADMPCQVSRECKRERRNKRHGEEAAQ